MGVFDVDSIVDYIGDKTLVDLSLRHLLSTGAIYEDMEGRKVIGKFGLARNPIITRLLTRLTEAIANGQTAKRQGLPIKEKAESTEEASIDKGKWRNECMNHKSVDNYVVCKFCGEEVIPDWELNGDGSEACGYCPECKNENHIAFDSKYSGERL